VRKNIIKAHRHGEACAAADRKIFIRVSQARIIVARIHCVDPIVTGGNQSKPAARYSVVKLV
jgi:hypothetical protein